MIHERQVQARQWRAHQIAVVIAKDRRGAEARFQRIYQPSDQRKNPAIVMFVFQEIAGVGNQIGRVGLDAGDQFVISGIPSPPRRADR